LNIDSSLTNQPMRMVFHALLRIENGRSKFIFTTQNACIYNVIQRIWFAFAMHELAGFTTLSIILATLTKH